MNIEFVIGLVLVLILTTLLMVNYIGAPLY